MSGIKKKRPAFTESVMHSMLRRGIGTGTGTNFRPWHTTENFDAHAHSGKYFCKLANRYRHFLSESEEGMLYGALRDGDTEDVRENHRLEIPLTERICKAFGFRHPKSNGDGKPLSPFTTDLLLTRTTQPRYVALSAKQRRVLRDPKECRSLFVEHVYWSLHQVPFLVATELEITRNSLQSLRFLQPVGQVSEHNLLNNSSCAEFHELVLKANWKLPLVEAIRQIALTMGIDSAAALELFKRLVWSGVLSCDLERSLTLSTRNAIVQR